MTNSEAEKILGKLLTEPKELEWFEFKTAKSSFEFDKIGKYFSALSNEANIKGKDYGWLIFGINNRRGIVGTSFKQDKASLEQLKSEIAHKTTGSITFIEIFELLFQEGRVVMFQIPAAPKGIPVAWRGQYWGRDGESLAPLNIQEIEHIRKQGNMQDWSAGICGYASKNDLSSEAIKKAKMEYKKKNPERSKEIDSWDDIKFLNKAKIAIEGKITNTAIVLLGKPESEHFLSPSVAKITWILRGENDIERDYMHFGPPFLLNVERLFKKIGNLNYRYMPGGSLFPIEIKQYDSWVIREALHNCIAHQDYEQCGRISVVERQDELIFSNPGNFIPESINDVIEKDSPPAIYRNSFLASAMVNLNMIDTIGSGIRRMFLTQKKRFFPLPDYDISNPKKVIVKIKGRIIDANYTRILIENEDIPLQTAISLDKVQKGIKLSRNEYSILKSKRLVEGRYPNIYISLGIASITDEKAKYIKYRGFDNKYYQDLIIAFIEQNGSATRKEIDELIIEKLPEIFSEQQKKRKVNNLLSKMSKDLKLIKNIGSTRNSIWIQTSNN
jgi:ATP-dependent DNA helicase RecG